MRPSAPAAAAKAWRSTLIGAMWVHDDAALPAVLHDLTTTVTPRLCHALEIERVSATVAFDLVAANRRIQ